MALSLIAYPKVIFTQSVEPSDKTAGLLWYDTDDGKLYSADGTNYNVIGASADINKLSDIDIALSHDAEISTGELIYTKLKTITLGLPLGTQTIRIKYDHDSTTSPWGKSRIYKNGVAVGVDNTAGSNWATISEDIEFVNGDTLELWGISNETGRILYVKNFRVYGYGVFDANMSGANS